MTTVFFDEPDGDWLFGGRRRSIDRDNEWLVVHASDLPLCTATDLQNALRKADDEMSGPNVVCVSAVAVEHLDYDWVPVEQVHFELNGGALTIVLSFAQSKPDDESDDTEAAMVAAMQPLLAVHKAELLHIDGDDYAGPNRIWTVRLGFRLRGRRLDSLYKAGDDILALLDALVGGVLTRETAGNLVRAGRADALIGQPEGHWLEAKSQHYDLKTTSGQIALAQAVSRFSNSEDGGLVVVGIAAKKTQNGEVLRRLTPMPESAGIARTYHRILHNRLFPLVRDIRIDAIPHGEGSELVLVDIPPQPEELKPFLVAGAIIDGKFDGAFMSIVRRRGDGSIPTTPQEIHSTLVAGRALLRGGKLPE
ncbi:hypothetical protein ACIPY0_14480 [Paenarthrobacter nicotinovorans]|uniref:hypothetical protein n=1 Tax=Paenarthrobacter nicotinovorans TaxID=29320 RepID=UPI0038254E52